MLLITQFKVLFLFSLVIRLILNESRLNSKLDVKNPYRSKSIGWGGGIVRLLPRIS